jgi:hypothetical protein
LRKIINRHNDVITTLRQKLAEIEREGEGRPGWKLEKRAEALEEAKRASGTIAVELKLEAANKRIACQDVFNEIRKGGAKTKPAPSERLYWLQQAQSLFNGRTPEQAIELYSYQLKKMTPAERLAWRHVFDDSLELSVYGEPDLEYQAAQVINQNRTLDEKAALHAMRKADRLEEFTPTLTAVFQANLKEASEGEESANDPDNVFSDIEQKIEAEFARV